MTWCGRWRRFSGTRRRACRWRRSWALAGGLTAQTAAQKVRVTVDGEPVPHFQCLVENGNLKVRFASGMVIYLR